jgi:hypothetical protein
MQSIIITLDPTVVFGIIFFSAVVYLIYKFCTGIDKELYEYNPKDYQIESLNYHKEWNSKFRDVYKRLDKLEKTGAKK